jgi:hypothetical protein
MLPATAPRLGVQGYQQLRRRVRAGEQTVCACGMHTLQACQPNSEKYSSLSQSSQTSSFAWNVSSTCLVCAVALQVGVGTSQLQADMVQRGGYQCIVNTDISSVVVHHMQELHRSIPQLQYRVGDARCGDLLC